VGDLRTLSTAFDRRFAAIVASDNAMPHLLCDDDIHAAFVECRRLLEPRGVLPISMRDYAAIGRRNPDHHSHGTYTVGDHTYTADQIWNWTGNHYDFTLRLTERFGDQPEGVREFHSRYYAVELPTLERLMLKAGFVSVARRDEQFFQPLLVAINPPVV